MNWTVLFTRSLLLAILLTISVMFILPFFWMLMTSLKAPVELMKWPPGWFPDTFRWQNYEEAVTYIPFFRYVGNTMVITLGSIVGVLISCPMVAYGFSPINWPGRDVLFVVMLMTIMIPFPVTMLPLYVLFARIGWINTYLPLVLPLFFGVPFYIFLLRQFFMTIPGELTDAARIDGASEPRIYLQLILPLTKPALATVVLFQFLSSWSDFLGPLLYLRDSRYVHDCCRAADVPFRARYGVPSADGGLDRTYRTHHCYLLSGTAHLHTGHYLDWTTRNLICPRFENLPFSQMRVA